MKYIGGACCLLLIVVVVFGAIGNWFSDRRMCRWGMSNSVQVMCIQCHGRGWTQSQQRTLSFNGEAFEDVAHPATMCDACNGTGSVMR